jgi:hypothetical protein
MIYLHGGRIYEMQRIILKLYGATPRKDFQDMSMREAEDGIPELGPYRKQCEKRYFKDYRRYKLRNERSME